ncbi:hypothetical protein [Natronoglomus mannanivorans]|uniref:Uncharacterized protein n=1 Tax=Natronoglomus mannanivorans TaxID=2979990 RepID=A0AAP2Z5J7_9EURY|nr:hypothetical protein [Halobacteria archaeon AArc-xg1-1]
MPTNEEASDPPEGLDSVEDAWRTRLLEAGIDRSIASGITAELQSQPALTIGSPDETTVRRCIRRSIDRLDLEAYGVDDAETDGIKRDLVATLEAGLAGRLDGPVAMCAPDDEPTAVPVDATVEYDKSEAVDDSRSGHESTHGRQRVEFGSDRGEEDHDTVEAVWQAKLREAGIDRSIAAGITAELQSHLAVTTGSPDETTVLRCVGQAIDRLDLGAYGIGEMDAIAIKRDLEAALQAGIEGRLDGPVALRMPSDRPTYVPTDRRVSSDETTRKTDRTESGHRTDSTDDPNGPTASFETGPSPSSTNGLDPTIGTPPVDTGAQNRETDHVASSDSQRSEQDPSAGTDQSEPVQVLREEFRRIVNEEGIERSDVVAAAEVAAGDREVDGLDESTRRLVEDLEQLVAERRFPTTHLVAAARSLD